MSASRKPLDFVGKASEKAVAFGLRGGGGHVVHTRHVSGPGTSGALPDRCRDIPTIGESQSSAANGNRTSNRAPVLRLCADSVPRWA